MKKTQRSIGLTPLDSLLVFVPIAIALRWLQADPSWVFITSCLAIVPLAGWMGKATEHSAARLVVNRIADDGECNWMEGVQLLAVYLMLGIAFYFLPP